MLSYETQIPPPIGVSPTSTGGPGVSIIGPMFCRRRGAVGGLSRTGRGIVVTDGACENAAPAPTRMLWLPCTTSKKATSDGGPL